MLITGQRVARNADPSGEALSLHPKKQHDGDRERQAVAPKLHPLPAGSLVPQLPAAFVMAQRAPGLSMGQQNLPRQGPAGVRETTGQAEQFDPQWRGDDQQGQ